MDGLRADDPFHSEITVDQLTKAERLRIVYQILTETEEHHGAAMIFRDDLPWTAFPLHDEDVNKKWLKSWSKKWFLDDKDLNEVRDEFGEKVPFCLWHAYCNITDRLHSISSFCSNISCGLLFQLWWVH